ncbi:TPA: hypothetical protein JTN37_004547 [Escherichia coli]|uniref:hypothetical protein n=1 Tax=Escherichia coli TaxID=562 RepID=UPI00301BBC9F|nr:hypothetical protein [Escherichia coli]
MNNKTKISIFIVAFLTVMSCYIALFYYQIGRGVVAEWWLRNVTEKKLQISKNKPNERVIIVAGSNGLFGFDSDLIAKETGMDVVNLSLHAGLDLSFYRMMIEQTVRKDDVVVMPLEFSYYSLKDEYTGWFVDNMMAWGDDYLKWLSPWKKIEFLSHVSLSRVVTGVTSPIKNNFDSLQQVMRYSNNNGMYAGYNYKSLNNGGDINRFGFMHDLVKYMIADPDANRETLSYGKYDIQVSGHAIDELMTIKNIVQSRGATFYMSWPTTMKTKYFNENDAQSKYFVDAILTQLGEKGFSFICDPFYANLSPDYFLDTHYHLNGNGARLRSIKFAKCLNKIAK